MFNRLGSYRGILGFLTAAFTLALLSLVTFVQSTVTGGDTEILRLLVWEGYVPAKYVAEFEKEIELKYGRKVSLEITFAKSHDDFFDPVRAKKIDVITISHHTIKDERFDYITKRLILPVNIANIPNFPHVIPELQGADYHLNDGNLYGVPVANGPYGLAYNTDQVSLAPSSWSVLWNPASKGRYSIGKNEYLYNVNITARAMGYPTETIHDYNTLNNDTFKAKLRELAVNARSLWVGVDKKEDLFGLLYATAWGDSFKDLERSGEVWEMAAPEEGTLWWVDEYALTWALINSPFKKKIAEEWINKSLSADFQLNHLVREVGIFPVVTNIGNLLTAEEKRRIQSSSDKSLSNTRVLQHTYSQRDRNGFRRLWNEALRARLTQR